MTVLPRRMPAWPGQAVYGVLGMLLIYHSLVTLPKSVGAGMGIARTLLMAMALYLFSHLLRAVRLVILVGNPRVSLRQIALVHLTTAAASLLLPFKLGEFFRVAELGHLLDDLRYSVTVVWIERAFDFAVLALVILLLSVSAPDMLAGIRALVVIAVCFVGITLIAFTLVPEGLATLSLFVLRRYHGAGAVRAMSTLQWLREAVALGPRMIVGKVATLLVISLGIWGLELATLTWALPESSTGLLSRLGALATYLSSGSLHGVRVDPADHYGLYTLAMAGALLPLGCVCALLYLPARFGWRVASRGSAA